jgi:hypothetical protein
MRTATTTCVEINASTTECITEYPDTSETSSSTIASVYNGFTYGETMISLFLFLIFFVGVFSVFWFGIIKPHIHKIHKK